MNIQKIELVDNGLNGIVISGVRAETKEHGTTVLVDYNDTYKVPMSRDLISKFQDLKAYMASALNVGVEAHVMAASQGTPDVLNSEMVSLINFLDSLTITKVSRKDNVFRIAGKICNLDNMTVGLSTAGITPNTGYSFYEQLSELYTDLCRDVTAFVESTKLLTMAPRQYMLELFANDEDGVARVEAMTDKEAEDAMIQKLEAKGHIILSPPEDIATTTDSNESSDFPIISQEQPTTVPDAEDEF